MTVELAIYHLGVAEKIRNRVQSQGRIWIRPRNKKGNRCYRRPGYYFSQHYIIFRHRCFLAWNPMVFRESDPLAPLIIQIHLSHFKNFSDFMRWAKAAFGKALPIVLEARIFRFDCPIDLDVTYESMRRCLSQPRAQTREEFKSETRTSYLGTSPRETCVYEKKIKKSLLDYRRESARQKGPDALVKAIRIEVRLKGKYLPIERLRDIERLRNSSPFNHLRLNTVRRVLLDGDLLPKTRLILDAYLQRCRKVGAQEARRSFSQHGNFKRTIEKYLGPLKGLNLQKAWQRRMRRFLGSELLVFPPPVDAAYLEQFNKPALEVLPGCLGAAEFVLGGSTPKNGVLQ